MSKYLHLILLSLLQFLLTQKIELKAKKSPHPPSSSPASASSSLINILNEQYVGELFIGTPPQSISLLLSTSFYLFAIQNKTQSVPFGYSSLDSSSLSYNQYNTGTFFHNNYYQYGLLGNESFTFNSIPHSITLDFLLTHKNGRCDNADGILGLDYSDSGLMNFKSQSLIESLYSQGIIKSQRFTFQYNTSEDTSSVLTIGDIDENIIGNSKRYHSFKLLEDSFAQYWVVNAAKVYFGDEALNNSMSSKNKVRFAFENAFIMAPIKIQHFLRDNYLLSFLSNGDCIEKKGFGCVWFQCKQQIDVSTLKPMKFLIKGYEFSLESTELFIEYNSTKVFAVSVNDKGPGTKEDWIIGEPFMRKYQVVYDKDRRSIGIYSAKGLVYIGVGDYADEGDDEGSSSQLLVVALSVAGVGLLVVMFCVCRTTRLNRVKTRKMYDQLTGSSSPFSNSE